MSNKPVSYESVNTQHEDLIFPLFGLFLYFRSDPPLYSETDFLSTFP